MSAGEENKILDKATFEWGGIVPCTEFPFSQMDLLRRWFPQLDWKLDLMFEKMGEYNEKLLNMEKAKDIEIAFLEKKIEKLENKNKLLIRRKKCR
jgi:hypothetical protein